MKEKQVKGYISANKDYIKESFSGEIIDKPIRWPKELGAEHPFNFEDVEALYKKFGLVNGAINKITDSIVGEFTVNAKNPNVLELVTNFIKDNNFSVVLREWIREALLKGNGFMEIDAKEGKVRVLNANNMYVKRDKNGKVLEYNQYVGDVNKITQRKIINFKTNQIAHLKINTISDEPYGIGIVWPSERVIENIILNETDVHKLQSRKAGAPLHVQIGQPGEVADTAAINNFSASMQYMNNRTEWVTDGNVKLTPINFGEIGKNLTDMLMYDFRQLIAGMDIPEVLLNSGQLNEGIARVQLEGWHARMISYQDMIEGIIIEKIFNPYLIGQGLKGEIDFVWNIPSQEVINTRIEMIGRYLSQSNLSDNMKRMLELEVARLLNIQDAENYLAAPDSGLAGVYTQPPMAINPNINPDNQSSAQSSAQNPEKKREMNVPLPKVPGANAMLKEKIDFGNMTIREFINLKEIKGFNYSDYLLAILNRVKTDKFDDLKAITEKDFQDGLLNESEIGKLRTILKEGFRRNQSINNIETNIKDSIQLKDRIKEDGSILSASTRPEMIARTETIRLANEGLLDLFKENNIEKKRWIAAWSDRTCEYCMALDGQIVGINEMFNSPIGNVNSPGLHVNCRCSIISE